MGYFTFFVNQAGRKVVLWDRLVLAWLVVILACVAGATAMWYALTGDWWDGVLMGIAMGVAYAAQLTVYSFRTPVEQLPPLR